MSGIPFIGFLAFVFVGMTLINRIMEGAFITNADVAIVNQLTIIRTVTIGTWSVPVPNLSFFTEGLPHLVKWDYSFFGGNAGVIQYFLYSLTAALSFGLALAVMGLLYNYFSRVR